MSSELSSHDLDRFRGELLALVRRTSGTRDQIERESLDAGGGGLDTQGDRGADQEFEEVDLDSLEIEDSAAEAAVAALRRIEDGTYGRCLSCRGWIPHGRLATVPYAPLCVTCQEALEAEAD